MPELPEVEVTRLSFASRIEGALVLHARLGKPLRWPLGVPIETLVGLRIHAVRRRAKYLILDMSQGILLLHLGMSGSLRFEKQIAAAGVHDHFDLVTDLGTLRLHDPRRFGAVVYCASQEDPVAQKLLGHLGVEPLSLDFDALEFYRQLHLRTAAIKQVLLAGDVVVGVGNIYASEALFMAKIRPTTRASRISRPRAQRLHSAIVEVLARAVHTGGSTLRDFSNAQGESGYFQLEAKVYDRRGEPCTLCGTPIRCIRQGQRATYFCASCQKP